MPGKAEIFQEKGARDLDRLICSREEDAAAVWWTMENQPILYSAADMPRHCIRPATDIITNKL